MALFRGAGVALVTPFHADGSVDYEKLAELVEEQIAGGTDAIIACGTTGEAATMSEEEHMDVIRFIIKAVNHRIPVIAGTGSNCTATAIDLSKQAEEAGAEGVLLVTPYYNKATQGGLIQHYEAVAGAISLPCILYNVPSRTGVTIQPETMAYLYQHVENIVGVKDATGNISMITKLMSLVDENFLLYSGDDDQIVPLLSVGASGVISVLSNVAPRETHEIYQKWFDGDIKGAREAQFKAYPLIKALFAEVNPIPVKAALNLMGKNVGSLRLPMTEATDSTKALLKDEMTKYGIL
ncbi:MAG: 4-hydroxy-tetrahydrodipicolinate synthase [Lachnospiraceae bacterium]|nr:4-hydroxy-tetrahydrodipicolinate synthase [Lachnospiraceae bacterium]